jgi:hypothetical protein
MSGLISGVNINDPTVVAAFKAALLHQGLIALLIFAALGLAWVSIRASRPLARDGAAQTPRTPGDVQAEPAGRRVLRVGFGLLWVFDGILQAQPKMALGLPSQVIEPTAASSPQWVQHLVNWAGTSWSHHPIQAGASAVWIQVGIGLWLLFAARGAWSRLAGLVSVGWGLAVWVFGESFGGIFAPGLTWLSGAPGAVLLYCVGGTLIVLPERAWRTLRLGRLALAGLGLFLIGMAVLQAWPGRGFWQGRLHGQPGTLTGIVQAMAGTPEPRFLSSWVSAFAIFTAGHGFAVNLVGVAALAVTGAAFLTRQPKLVRAALVFFTVLCLADWVLIEDFGFFGGLGTDPNSMIPFALLAAVGYLAVAQVPVPQAALTTPQAASAGPHAPVTWRDRAQPAALRQWVMTASFPTVASAGAIALIILGAAPMAAAQTNLTADPILAEAINGCSAPLNYPAPAFRPTYQHGENICWRVSASFTGRPAPPALPARRWSLPASSWGSQACRVGVSSSRGVLAGVSSWPFGRGWR